MEKGVNDQDVLKLIDWLSSISASRYKH
jgi:hypothetical protein